MTAIDLAGRAQEWLAAWNAHDLERILAHYADDVELASPFVGTLTGRSAGVVRGKEALRFDFIRLYVGVRSCVLEYQSVNGLRAAEMMEFDEQAKVRRVLAHYAEDRQLARMEVCGAA
jgi:hypothetical protein